MAAITAGAGLQADAAPCGPSEGDPHPRTVLALYDGTREPDPRDTRIHAFLEMPLNHLGYVLRYQDVNEDLGFGGPVAAMVSWFDRPVSAAEDFADWAADIPEGCTPPATVALDHPGVALTPEASASRDAYLARLGIEVGGPEIAVGLDASVSQQDQALVNLETDFLLEHRTFPLLTATDSARSHLRISSGSAFLDLVVTTSNGGYAHGAAALQSDSRGGGLWVLDPFAFLEQIIDPAPWPAPDTTTLAGRRMFFATVTSEGWLAMLPSRDFGDEPPLAAEVLADDLIANFPDLPISVGILAGDLDPAAAGGLAPRGRDAAERALAQPHVQPATTGLSMIQNWRFFAAYDPEREASAVQEGRVSTDRSASLVTSAVQTLGGAFADDPLSALDISPSAPRKYANPPFDIAAETTGAIDTVAALAPEAAAPPIFLWSGDARPFPEAVAAVASADALALGGGGGLYHPAAPSLSNLWPLAAPGEEGGRQIYDALSGDDAYTRYWTDPLYGFQALARTLEWTESPRRLKPFQLAFAARSAVDFATRHAVEMHLSAAQEEAVIPVTAARYARIAEGFFSYRAEPDGALVWRILDRGALQTVRFDAAKALALDLATSRGVLGARRANGSLYVALDPTNDAPRVALAESDVPFGMVLDSPAPALLESRLDVLTAGRDGCTTAATVTGFAGGETIWAAEPGVVYDVALFQTGSTDERLFWDQATADAEGRLSVSLPIQARQVVDLVLSAPCAQG